MAANINIPDISKFAIEISNKLTLPATILTNVLHKVMLHMLRSMNLVANSVAIFLCYLYIKNFRSHSLILVDGYVTIFKTFAEYIGATACVCYGLLERELSYLILGFVCISMGLGLKTLLLYHQKVHQDQCTQFASRFVSAMYLICVFLSCSAFHDIALKMGALCCASRILTCVVPLVALSDTFRAGGSTFFWLCTDALAISVLWWYCQHLSLKYFVVVPSVIGIIFTFIRYVLDEIQKAASKEVEKDLYSRY